MEPRALEKLGAGAWKRGNKRILFTCAGAAYMMFADQMTFQRQQEQAGGTP